MLYADLSMDTLCCPKCSSEVDKHCRFCNWLVCTTCRVIFGKNNYTEHKQKGSERG